MADAEQKDAPPRKRGGKLIAILVLLIAAGGSGGGAYLALAQKRPPAQEADEDGVEAVGPALPLESFLVNLNEPGGTRYLKLTVELELKRALTPEKQKLTVRLRDGVIVFLASLKVSDIQSDKGKQAVREKLLALSREVYGKKAVRAVYFKEFVMQ